MTAAFRLIAILALVSLALLLVTAGLAHANGPATQSIRKANSAINALLRQDLAPGSEQERERRAKLAREVSRMIDAEELTRRTLRDHLAGLSASERKEFQALLGALVAQNYTDALQSQPVYEIKYLKEERVKKAGRFHRRVITELHTTRHGRPYVVELEYWLHKKDGQWRIVDVVTEGASLTDNYRALFNKIIAGEAGYPGLVARMQKRYKEELR